MQSIGAKVYIDGAGEFKNDLNTMIQATKTFKAELDAVNKSSLNPFEKASLSKSALLKEIEAQKDKIALLNDKLQEASDKYGENSTQALKWKEQLEKANGALASMEQQLKSIKNPLEIVGDEMKKAGDSLQKWGTNISRAGDKLTMSVTTPIVAGFTAAGKAAVDFESAMAGVQKTVDETAKTSYADLANAIKKMSGETGIAKEEIAAVMEAGGQLGIVADDLKDFTQTMIDLGVSTNLSADEAATALARFANITGDTNYSKLGADIVALGNNFATTESEIVEMSTRLASTATIAGMSSTDILALATAMSSVGIQAEAGGTAMSQTLAQITSAVAEFSDGNGEKLEKIAQVANMSAQEFADAWTKNPIDAVNAFIAGLGGLDEKGENATLVLEELGMSGIRQSNMLKSLSLASEQLAGAIAMSSDAYEQNNALTAEAEKRYSTHENKILALKERLGNLAVEIGERLLPYVDRFINFADKLLAKWDSLDQGTKDMILKGALLAATLGPILSIGGRLISGVGTLLNLGGGLIGGIGKIISLFGSVGTGITGITGGLGSIVGAISGGGGVIGVLGGLASAAAPFLVGGAVVAGIGFGVYEIVKHWDDICDAAKKVGDWVGDRWNDLKDATGKAWNAITDGISNAWDGITDVTKTAARGIGNFLSDSWDNIKSVAGTAWDGIKGVVGSAWDGIVDLTHNAVDGIGSFLSSAWDGITSVASSAWNGLTGVIGGAWDGITSVVSNAASGLGNILSGAWNGITSAASSAFSGLKGIVGDAMSAIGSAASSAWNWGKDLASNIGSGISSGWNYVKGAVGNLASGIASFLHFSEPDKGPLSNFHTFMPDMIKLMAQGIYQNIGTLEKAANTMAEVLTPTMATPTANTATSTTNVTHGDVVLNVYGANGQDVNELADIVMRKLTVQVNRQAVVYG